MLTNVLRSCRNMTLGCAPRKQRSIDIPDALTRPIGFLNYTQGSSIFSSSTLSITLALAFPLFLALSRPARAETPFSFESAPGRLPKDVVPEDYSISIVPDIKVLTLSGTESVTLDFRKPSATIQFNSLNVKLDQVTLDGQPVKAVVSDDGAQLTTLTLAKPAPTGRHILFFTYTGKIETKPQGLFA